MPDLSHDTVDNYDGSKDQLEALLLQGRRDALKAVYDRDFEEVYYFILAFLQDGDIAGKLASETFVSLWQKRGNLKHASQVRPYLFILAKEKCLSFLEKRIL